MNAKENIASLIAAACAAHEPPLMIEPARLVEMLETPKDSAHGDVALPCFTFAKELRSAPPKIAANLAQALRAATTGGSFIAEIKVIGPYINFVLNKASIAASLVPAILQGDFLKQQSYRSGKVMVEYSQPNTHKAFHVGHIRSASLGDSLWRMMDFLGYEVVPVNYINDEGAHVARCLWYLQTYYKGETPVKNRGEFLGGLYHKGVEMLDASLVTKVPLFHVVTAKVLDKEALPGADKLSRVKVDTGVSQHIVVCGAQGFAVGDIVAYAKVGAKVDGRAVGTIEKAGVSSEGMILSEKELGLSDNNDQAHCFAGSTVPGLEVADIFRIPGALPENLSVVAEYTRRFAEVAQLQRELEDREPKITKLWEQTRDWSMQDFYEVYDWLNCRFDHYFYATELNARSRELVKKEYEKGTFVLDQGAIGADLRQWGLGFCLLLKRNGAALYATLDLVLAQDKFEKFQIQHALYVVDSGQTLHFQQVFKCLELMGYEQAKNCHHVGFALVVRPDGKMSSRKGNTILFSELKDRLLAKIHADFLDKYRDDWSKEEIEATAHAIALGTMRYGMLNQDNNSQVIFDLDEWTAKSGNTGPYLMYAYARISSILREAGPSAPLEATNWGLLTHETETELMRHLQSYHDVVQRAADTYSPHLVCTFVYTLAKRFHAMYHECSVLHAETPELRAARIALMTAAGKVIQHGLGLLGIRTVERM